MKYIRFSRYLAQFWKIEALALILSGLSMALGLVSPYLTKLIIDNAYPNKDLRLFIILAGGIAIVFIAGSLFKGLSSYLARYVRLRVNLGINKNVFKKIQNMGYDFFQNSSTGENLYKINYDIEQVTQLIADVLPQVVILIPKSIFILAIIFYVNPKMFIFALALTPFLYITPWYFTKKMRKSWKIVVENSQAIFKRLQESLSHMHLVKAYGKERQESSSYIKAVINNIRCRLKNTRLEVTASFLNSAIQKAILGLIIFYGGYQVIKGRMTLGSLGAISIYLSQLSGVQAAFANFIQQISSGLVSCERLDKVLELEAGSIEDLGARKAGFNSARIEFKNLTFGYAGEGLKPSPADRKILDSVNFSIEGGSCVAIAGHSGCGKTTIVNLILRLYRPLSGQILIDGMDIDSIDSRSLYSQIGAVLQEPYLWNDTIENNIKYGRECASLEEVKYAAKIACINTFIDSLPKGYKTIIGENACKISEGQKQRIAIARAVIKKPKILILDEALSSVDAYLEKRIIYNIRDTLKDATIIIISHHVSTIEKAGLVYFLKETGRIDIGRHEDLLKENIEYKNYIFNI